jgi:hypothetical protein
MRSAHVMVDRERSTISCRGSDIRPGVRVRAAPLQARQLQIRGRILGLRMPQRQHHTRRIVQMTCRQRLCKSQAIASVLVVFRHSAAQSRDRRFRIPTTRGPLPRFQPSSRLPAVQCLVALSDAARTEE